MNVHRCTKCPVWGLFTCRCCSLPHADAAPTSFPQHFSLPTYPQQCLFNPLCWVAGFMFIKQHREKRLHGLIHMSIGTLFMLCRLSQSSGVVAEYMSVKLDMWSIAESLWWSGCEHLLHAESLVEWVLQIVQLAPSDPTACFAIFPAHKIFSCRNIGLAWRAKFNRISCPFLYPLVVFPILLTRLFECMSDTAVQGWTLFRALISTNWCRAIVLWQVFSLRARNEAFLCETTMWIVDTMMIG